MATNSIPTATITKVVAKQRKKLSKTQDLAKLRRWELDRYFHGLNALEDFTSGKISSIPKKILSDEFMKIMKASSFLILYNYIEGCVLEAFLEIYSEIKESGISYSEMRVEFQKIWIAYQTKPLLLDPTASHNSYNTIAKEIISELMLKNCIDMDRKALPISGNLNEKKIKTVCDLHGIKLSSKMTKVEDGMEVVMTKRTDLAHGSISFGECGREYVVSDLERIKENALKYMDIFLAGIDTFVVSKRYRAA